MPFVLFIGLLGTFITTLVAMLLPAIGVWYGSWLDNLIQRLTEVNMVLPGLAIAVLANLLFGMDIWIVLGIIVVVNALGADQVFSFGVPSGKGSPLHRNGTLVWRQ